MAATRIVGTSIGLVTNQDYIDATVDITNLMNDRPGLDGFFYSVFYVFFEQYIIIAQQAAILIAGSFCKHIFFSNFILDNISPTSFRRCCYVDVFLIFGQSLCHFFVQLFDCVYCD